MILTKYWSGFVFQLGTEVSGSFRQSRHTLANSEPGENHSIQRISANSGGAPCHDTKLLRSGWCNAISSLQSAYQAGRTVPSEEVNESRVNTISCHPDDIDFQR